jgi:hypothetical protein
MFHWTKREINLLCIGVLFIVIALVLSFAVR